MTREEAIWRLENCLDCTDCFTCGSHDDALVMAIAALREQEERSKGCEWCWHFQSDPQYLVSRGDGMYEEVTFKLCPVCGRKLEVEGQ